MKDYGRVDGEFTRELGSDRIVKGRPRDVYSGRVIRNRSVSGGTESKVKNSEFDDLFYDEALEEFKNSSEFIRISREIDIARELFYNDEDDNYEIEEEYVMGDIDISSIIKEYRKNVEENISKEVKKSVVEDSSIYSGSESIDLEEDTSDSSNLEKGKSMKKSSKKPYIIGGIVVVVLVGLIGYRLVVNRRVKDIEELTTRVSEMYTNSKKEDINSSISQSTVDRYLKSLDSMDYVDTMTRYNLEKELSTISYYIEDKDTLDKISSNGYDLNTNGTLDELEGVLSSAKDYSVSSLAVSVSSRAKDLKSSYEYFMDLRDDLSTITDYSSFDEKGYQLKINKVSYKENKKELQNLYDKLVEAKNQEKEIEKLKSEATEEALKKAEEIKNSMEKELDTARKELSEYQEKVGGMFSEFIDKVSEMFNNLKENIFG